MLSSSMIRGKTLLKIWLDGANQDYDLLMIFGCPAYCVTEGKLDHRAKEFVFFGVKRNLKGYKLLDNKTRRLCWKGMPYSMRLQ